MILGLKLIDLAVIAIYFAVVMAIGFWASRKVKTDEDFFLGGRRFGKGLLVMHWLCTGTHSEMAVQVAGASARVGLGGIWYHWMYLFSTPFYWLIAPIIRRLRVVTTGDFFRIRYGRGLEMLYSVIALLYLVQTMAALLRGAGAAIAGATGAALQDAEGAASALSTEAWVILLSVLFSTYVMAGGLVAAAYTDYLQGVMIIVLSVLLIPLGLAVVGGAAGLHGALDPSLFSIMAPPGAKEGNVTFVVAMSLLSLAGVVVQPHVMNATGSGKTEMEARVGMCFGNFIKRFLTMAWAFTGLIALVMFPQIMEGLDPQSVEARIQSETLFGRAIHILLGDGWRGLMIACIVAGVTSAETFMVVGAGVFTRNFYRHLVEGRSDRHYLWVGRLASVGMLVVAIGTALWGGSVTDLFLSSVKVIGLLGAAFWLGVVWRRANATAVWCSFAASVGLWLLANVSVPDAAGALAPLRGPASGLVAIGETLGVRGLSPPVETLLMLAIQFGAMLLVSLITTDQRRAQLDLFYARLLTPVGQEQATAQRSDNVELTDPGWAVGLHGQLLSYDKAASFGYEAPRRWGLEFPRMTWVDGAGFMLSWLLVGALIGLLAWLARIGA